MLLVPARRSPIPLPDPTGRTSTLVPGYRTSKRRAISETIGAMVVEPLMSSFAVAAAPASAP